MFVAILELTLVLSIWLRESSFAVELSYLVESSFISVEIFVLVPLKLAQRFIAVSINSYELVSEAFFLAVTVEVVILESAFVDKLFRDVFSLFIIGFVAFKQALIVGAISEDINSFSFGFSTHKVTDVVGSVFLVESAEAVGIVLG